MTTARSEILSNIRRSLGVNGTETMRNHAVDERIKRAPKGVIPARGQLEPEARLKLFLYMLESVSATYQEVSSTAAIPEAIAQYLRDHNAPATLKIGADSRLSALPWKTTSLEVSHGASDGHDLNALSYAFSAVAETGTLIMNSSNDNPTTLNFLPDNHIVILNAADLVGDLEAVWQKLRMRYGKHSMPRTVNMITGPSRSADIEQTLLLGAHGPRNLHVIVLR